MLPEIERLLILQLRDQELADLESDLKRIPAEKELAKARLANTQKAVEEAKATQQENEMAVKSVELDIKTRKTTIGRLKTQQFETRKNEEFATIGEEIERYQSEIDDLETTELELMEVGDALQQKRQEAQEKLKKAQESVDEELAAYERREEEEKARLAEVQEQRDAAQAAVEDQDLLDTYNRLRKARGTKVVVNLSPSGQCEGCHMKVTSACLLKVQADKELVQCENCGRILFPG